MNSKMQLSKEELRENKPNRDEYLTKPKIPLIVVLDNVTNSYNIGAFIRLADAFAIEKVIVCGALTISDKKMKKASRNEAKWVCVEYSDSTTTSLQTLLDDGYTVYSVELCHKSVDYSAVTYSAPSVLVLGNAFYAMKGLCSHVERETDLLDKLRKLSHPTKSIKHAFFRYLRDDYYLQGNCKSPSPEHIEAVRKRLYEIIE